MSVVVIVIAVVGIVFTMYACVRMVTALVRNEPRESVLGWFALMLIVGVAVFAVDRVIS